jgi:hypothetical protein
MANITPPDNVVSYTIEAINKVIYIIKFSEVQIKLLIDLLSEKGFMITRAEFGDFLISQCVFDADGVIKSIKEAGADINTCIFDILKECIEVNPGLHPKSSIFINHEGKLVTSSEEDEYPPLISNDCWSFPYKAIKYSDRNLMTPEELLKEGYKIVNWPGQNMHISIKVIDDAETKMLSGFRSKITPLNYRKLICFYCVGNYHYVAELLKSTGLDENLIIRELYQNILAFNTKLLINSNTGSLPLDVDSGLHLHDSIENMFLSTIEEFLASQEENEEEENDEDDVKVLSPQRGRRKKNVEKVQKISFNDVRVKDIISLGEKIKTRVFGQDKAIDAVVSAIKRAKAGLREPGQPIVTSIFTGPTGTGKTLTTKIIAESLIRDKNALLRLDCSEYGLEHEVAKLIGSPNGYIGYEDGGILTNKMIAYPFCVVLFDEIEKAHPKFYDILLQIFDEGRLTDNHGRTVSFEQAIIIMTSNLGSGEISKIKGNSLGFVHHRHTSEDREKKIDSAVNIRLKKHFKPEFLNRIDEVVVFKSLEKTECEQIVKHELGKLRKRLLKNNKRVLFESSVVSFLVEKGFSPEYGARPLLRTIKSQVSDILAEKILSGELDNSEKVMVSMEEDGLKFIVEPSKTKPPVRKGSKLKSSLPLNADEIEAVLFDKDE